MSDDAIRALVGPTSMPVRNHAWWDDDTYVHVGRLPAALVTELSGGLLHDGIDVRLNRLVVESDVTLLVGPVLPHEVIGFSGGNKYLFPGLSGQEMIDVTHWLGALITSSTIIGTRGVTPVRALVDAAAGLVPGERHALCVVVDHESGGLESLSFGEPGAAWAEAADVAAETHVEYLDRPVRRVLSLIPTRYPDLWTGAKGFYKVEPIVADGGEVVLYAPHITEIAAMHPRLDGDRLPLPRLLPGPLGPLPRCPLGRAGACHPPVRRRDLRRGDGTAARQGDPGHRHSRRRRAAGQPRVPRSGRRRRRGGGRPTPTRWWCPTPARCSTGCGDEPSLARIDHAELGPDGIERGGQGDRLVQGNDRALGAPLLEAAVHLVDLETEPVSLVARRRCARRRPGSTR